MGSAQSASPVVTIARDASAAEGDPLTFLVRADPAPSVDLTVGVKITSSSGCTLPQAPQSVTIYAGKMEAALTVPTSGAAAGEKACTVTATIAAGAGYRVGAGTAASASATLTRKPDTPMVSITETAPTVADGTPCRSR